MSTRDSYWLICPFCGHKHGDAFEICADTASLVFCDECDNQFVCYAEHSVDYIAKVPLTDREKAIVRGVWGDQ